MTEKYRKAPSGEWLGYPFLRLEDISQESFQFHKFTALSLVENRMGRVYLRMEHEFYQKFLEAVRKRYGNISASNVEKAALEAVKNWVEEALAE